MKFSISILLEKVAVAVILGLIMGILLPILPASIAGSVASPVVPLFACIVMSIVGDIQSYFKLKSLSSNDEK